MPKLIIIFLFTLGLNLSLGTLINRPWASTPDWVYYIPGSGSFINDIVMDINEKSVIIGGTLSNVDGPNGRNDTDLDAYMLSISSSQGSAIEPNWEWRIPSVGDQELLDLYFSASSNIIIGCGYYEGDEFGVAFAAKDGWLNSFSPSQGSIALQFKLRGNGDDIINSCIIDDGESSATSSSRIYFAGSSSSTSFAQADPVLIPAGGSDLFIGYLGADFSFNATTQLLFLNNLNTPQDDIAHSLMATVNHIIFSSVLGSTSSSLFVAIPLDSSVLSIEDSLLLSDEHYPLGASALLSSSSSSTIPPVITIASNYTDAPSSSAADCIMSSHELETDSSTYNRIFDHSVSAGCVASSSLHYSPCFEDHISVIEHSDAMPGVPKSLSDSDLSVVLVRPDSLEWSSVFLGLRVNGNQIRGTAFTSSVGDIYVAGTTDTEIYNSPYPTTSSDQFSQPAFIARFSNLDGCVSSFDWVLIVIIGVSIFGGIILIAGLVILVGRSSPRSNGGAADAESLEPIVRNKTDATGLYEGGYSDDGAEDLPMRRTSAGRKAARTSQGRKASLSRKNSSKKNLLTAKPQAEPSRFDSESLDAISVGSQPLPTNIPEQPWDQRVRMVKLVATQPVSAVRIYVQHMLKAKRLYDCFYLANAVLLKARENATDEEYELALSDYIAVLKATNNIEEANRAQGELANFNRYMQKARQSPNGAAGSKPIVLADPSPMPIGAQMTEVSDTNQDPKLNPDAVLASLPPESPSGSDNNNNNNNNMKGPPPAVPDRPHRAFVPSMAPLLDPSLFEGLPDPTTAVTTTPDSPAKQSKDPPVAGPRKKSASRRSRAATKKSKRKSKAIPTATSKSPARRATDKSKSPSRRKEPTDKSKSPSRRKEPTDKSKSPSRRTPRTAAGKKAAEKPNVKGGEASPKASPARGRRPKSMSGRGAKIANSQSPARRVKKDTSNSRSPARRVKKDTSNSRSPARRVKKDTSNSRSPARRVKPPKADLAISILDTNGKDPWSHQTFSIAISDFALDAPDMDMSLN